MLAKQEDLGRSIKQRFSEYYATRKFEAQPCGKHFSLLEHLEENMTAITIEQVLPKDNTLLRKRHENHIFLSFAQLSLFTRKLSALALTLPFSKIECAFDYHSLSALFFYSFFKFPMISGAGIRTVKLTFVILIHMKIRM